MATFRDFEKFERIAEKIEATDFDHPFVITPDGEYLDEQIDTPHGRVRVPEVYHDDEDDITIDGVPMRESPRWEALTGMTGQYSYNGAVMHSSEFIGAGIAAYLIELAEDKPQMFVVVVVEVHPEDDDPDGDYDPEDGDADLPEPAGWAILRYKGDE